MIAAALIAILVIFGMGGGQLGQLMTEYAEDSMKIHIADEERRDLALDGLSVLQKDIKRLNKGVSKDFKEFDKLVKDYDSTPEDFDNLVSAVLVERQQEMDKIWADRGTMLSHIHIDEWQLIMESAKAAAAEKQAAKK